MLAVRVASKRLFRAPHESVGVAHLVQQCAEHGRDGILTDLGPFLQQDGLGAQPDVAASRLVKLRLSVRSTRSVGKVTDPTHGDVTSQSSSEEDAIQVREGLDHEVGTEVEVLFGVMDGDGQVTDYRQFVSGRRPLFVVPAHDLFGCLHGTHKGAFVWFCEDAFLVEINLALLARVGRSPLFAERLKSRFIQLFVEFLKPLLFMSMFLVLVFLVLVFLGLVFLELMFLVLMFLGLVFLVLMFFGLVFLVLMFFGLVFLELMFLELMFSMPRFLILKFFLLMFLVLMSSMPRFLILMLLVLLVSLPMFSMPMFLVLMFLVLMFLGLVFLMLMFLLLMFFVLMFSMPTFLILMFFLLMFLVLMSSMPRFMILMLLVLLVSLPMFPMPMFLAMIIFVRILRMSGFLVFHEAIHIMGLILAVFEFNMFRMVTRAHVRTL